jgi:hypothetical protein
MLLTLISIPVCMLLIYPLDRYLFNEFGYNPNHRWCYIHSLGNLIVTCLTFRGAITMFSSDQTIFNATGFNLSSSVVVMAMHLYHLLMFNISQLSILFHHIIMMMVLIIPFLNHTNYVLIFTDYSLFFLCGLPGGIDYYMMHWYYTGRLDKLTEKKINTRLNAYIRAPGILYGAFFVYRHYINGGDLSLLYMIIVVITFIWNAQYFSNEVAISYGYNLGLQSRLQSSSE